MTERDYALALGAVVQHVANEMDRVAPAAISVKEMVEARHEGFDPFSHGDLYRVKYNEGCKDTG